MKKLIFSIGLVFALTLNIFGLDPKQKEIIKNLYDNSVRVELESQQSFGTGVLFIRDKVGYVITASHVIENFKTEKILDNITKIVVDKPLISQCIKVNGDINATISYKFPCTIIGYSVKDKEDISVLKVDHEMDRVHPMEMVNDIVDIGEEIYHVGNLTSGIDTGLSLSQGTYAHNNIILNDRVYDMVQLAVIPGCSGGGIFRKSDGKYIGMIDRGHPTGGLGLIKTEKTIRKWLKEQNLLWIVDKTVPVPKDLNLEELGKKIIQDN